MPHSKLHKKKLSKNLIMLAIILGVMVLIWAITMIKMANAQDAPIVVERVPETELEYLPRLSDTNPDGSRKAKQVFDSEEAFIETRKAHLEGQKDHPERWWYDDLSLAPEEAEQKTGRPMAIQRERQLRNTYDQNRGIGGISTTRP